ncbi:TIGR01906 family membrane protein [Arthrobacter sp. TMN-50]
MAENDETEQRAGAAPAGETTSGTTRMPTEPAAKSIAEPAAEPAADPPAETTVKTSAEPIAEPAVAQRSSLPMRRASTMPDLSRFDATRRTDPANVPVPAGATGSVSVDEESADDAGGLDSAASTSVASAPDAATTVGAPAISAAAAAGSGRRVVGKPQGPSSPNDPAPDTAALSARPTEAEVNRRAAERDEAFTGKPVMARVFQVLIAVFFPIMLLAAAIRAVTSPLFLWVEYHRPGFPADSFGFNTDDRMTYGSYTVDYILNWASPRYLGDLVNTDGDQLFLDSEVGHMLDVKLVLVISFAVALAMLVFTLAACWHLARTYPGGVRRALFAGALTTLVLMVALTVTAILGWQTFFTQVHAIFFADGTWTFRADDTLIRLFPEQFWTDAAITVAALAVIVTLLTLVLTWPTKHRREKSRLADEAARRRRLDSLAL